MTIDLGAIEKSIEGNHPSSYELVRTSALVVLIEIAKASKEFVSDPGADAERLNAALAQIKGVK